MKKEMKKGSAYLVMRFMILGMISVVMATMVSCGGNSKSGGREAQELSGAGATFPLPFYNVVFEKFSEVNGDVVALAEEFAICEIRLWILRVAMRFCRIRR